MPKKLKPKTDPSNYADRSIVLAKKARAAEITVLNKSLGEFKQVCKEMAADTIKAANKSREIGIHLKTVCGHDQLPFEFWRANLEGKIDCDFEQAKRHVATANRMPQPAKTIEEAAPFIQVLFFASNLLEAPVREESQSALSTNQVQVFLDKVNIIRQSFEKAERATPMDKWKPSVIDTFLADTGWLSTLRDKAMKIRGQTYRE
jgi:hypothetical protein